MRRHLRRPLSALALATTLLALLIPRSLDASPRQLSPGFPAGAGVELVSSSPDSQWVHYAATLEGEAGPSLFAVSRNGGTSTRLTGPPAAGADYRFLGYSADAKYVLYSRLVANNPSGYFSVPVQGPESARTKLTSLGTHDRLFDPWVAGNTLLYVIRTSSPDSTLTTRHLYAVPAAGTQWDAVRLDQNGSGQWAPLPEIDRLLYTDGGGLYSRTLSNSASIAVRLDQTLPGQLGVGSFRASADGSQIAYVAEQTTLGETELFVVPIDGPASAAVKVSGTFQPNQIPAPHWSYIHFSPDGSHLLFNTFSTTNSWLYSSPTSGSSTDPTLLAMSLPGSIAPTVVGWSGDSALVWAALESPNRTDLYRVPAAGPASERQRLNGPDFSVGSVWQSNANATAVYLATSTASGSEMKELQRVAVVEENPVPVKISVLGLNQDIEPNQPVGGRFFNDRFVYVGQVEDGPTGELFSVGLTGPPSRSAVRLSAAQGAVSPYNIERASNDDWVVFPERLTGQPERAGMMGRIDGEGDTVTVHPLHPPWFQTDNLQVMADGVSILYTLEADDVQPMGPTLYLQIISDLFADGFETGGVTAWSPSSP